MWAMPCSNNSANPNGMALLSKKRQGKPPGSGEPSAITNELETKGIELMMISRQKGVRKKRPPSKSIQARLRSFVQRLL